MQFQTFLWNFWKTVKAIQKDLPVNIWHKNSLCWSPREFTTHVYPLGENKQWTPSSHDDDLIFPAWKKEFCALPTVQSNKRPSAFLEADLSSRVHSRCSKGQNLKHTCLDWLVKVIIARVKACVFAFSGTFLVRRFICFFSCFDGLGYEFVLSHLKKVKACCWCVLSPTSSASERRTLLCEISSLTPSSVFPPCFHSKGQDVPIQWTHMIYLRLTEHLPTQCLPPSVVPPHSKMIGFPMQQDDNGAGQVTYSH